jgi:hypothetical protein
MIDSKFVEAIAGLEARSYPKEIIEVGDGTGACLIFDPTADRYVPMERKVVRNLAVSTVESFAAAVVGEARRRGKVQMTAIFTPEGAVCSLDDAAGYGKVVFKRILSGQWQILAANLGKSLSHVGFVRLLQALRPSFPGDTYQEAMRDFRKVNLDGSQKIVSAPFLESGKSGTSYSVAIEVKSGVSDVAIPSGLMLRMPYATGEYDVELELDLKFNEGSSKACCLFELVFPTRGAVETAAMGDEVAFFQKAVSAYAEEDAGALDLIILENY